MATTLQDGTTMAQNRLMGTLQNMVGSGSISFDEAERIWTDYLRRADHIVTEVVIEPTITTKWFTFGQSHVHDLCGFRLDKDIVLEITAQNPSGVMMSHFGEIWAAIHDNKPGMEYFPRGCVTLDEIFAAGTDPYEVDRGEMFID